VQSSRICDITTTMIELFGRMGVESVLDERMNVAVDPDPHPHP
jgi:hypothetical protein